MRPGDDRTTCTRHVGRASTPGAGAPGRLARAAAVTVALAALAVGSAPARAAPVAPGGTSPLSSGSLVAPLLSARRVPGLVTAPIAQARLQGRVDALIARAPADTCVAISARGRPVVRVNADRPLEPASLLKLVTATAVLHHARPDEPVTTRAVAASAPAGGVVAGDLWLVGGGDGLLTTEGYRTTLRDPEQTVVRFAQLADALRARGVTEIQGGIVGDESRYDTARDVPTWPPRYRRQGTVGPLSALVVNDGVTGFDRDPDRAAAWVRPGDPALLAAATLRTLLEARGVRVRGGAAVGRAPEGAHEVARIQSTIFDQVAEMLAWSDNTTAELLAKEVGRRARGAGTTAAGIEESLEVLRGLGLPTAETVLVDGSGLDQGNRLTCDLVVGLLDRAGPQSRLAQGLPIAGRTGTLAQRMRGTVAEGTVSAKTGTLPTVASLAGFQRARRGEVVTFAFIQNGATVDTALQDELTRAIHEYPDVPDISDLLPPTRPPS